LLAEVPVERFVLAPDSVIEELAVFGDEAPKSVLVGRWLEEVRCRAFIGPIGAVGINDESARDVGEAQFVVKAGPTLLRFGSGSHDPIALFGMGFLEFAEATI